jgi:endonuclease I
VNTKKHIHFFSLYLLLAVPFLFAVSSAFAAAGGPPAGYYSSIDGLQDASLKSALGTLTRHRFTTLYDYGSGKNKTWQGLWQTDRNTSDNSVIDMYSNNKRYFNPSDTTASVTNCDIEHMFPNSWWGAKAGCKEAYCDLHHLVPADYSANRSKSNYGPGVPTDTTFNNGVWMNGKDATRSNITVFCPPDEYKGDFARALMYIAVTYGDTVTWQKDESVPHMDNDSWQEFKPATSALLLAWHRADPVSNKERVRMNTVYGIQGNRNPFIDYPCLAEYIWGDKVGTPVSLAALTCAYDDSFTDEGCSAVTTPVLTSPTSAINVGTTAAGTPISQTITVKGANLESGDLTLALSGTNASLFGLSPTSVSKSDAESGQTVTITYSPTANGSHTATLTISGCGITTKSFTITGTCSAVYTATWMVESSTQHAQTTAASGDAPNLPTPPSNCSATRVFVGWTAQESVSSKPADLFNASAPTMTSNKTYYAVYADATAGSVDAGSEVYTFAGKDWSTDTEDWASGKNGYRYIEGQGVQVSGSVTGANATCPNSYNDIRTVIVNYCTNAGSSGGSIVIEVGGTTKTNSVLHSTGGTTLRDSEFDFTAAPKNGAVKITVNQTSGSIYINSITINHGTPITYSDYSLSCGGSVPVSVTATFMNGETTVATETGNSGDAISTPANPTACEGYTFEGWSTATYETDNTGAPTIDYTGVFAATNKTYHAVYKRTEGSGGGGAAAGTTLWEENFTTFGQDSIPTGPGTAATVYGSATITYTCGNGTNTANTRVYNSGTMYAGGAKPELIVVSKNGSFSVSGIPTGNAKVMTLTFKSNKDTEVLSLTSGTSGITIGDVTVSSNTWTCDISNTINETFSLTITNTSTGSTGARVDNFEVSVKTPASGSGSTYYTTSPACCTHTITATSSDEAKGTAAVAVP